MLDDLKIMQICPDYLDYYFVMQIYSGIIISIGILFPITLVFTFFTLVVFLFMLKCNISAIKYYTMLAFFNFICVIFNIWRRPFLLIIDSIGLFLYVYFPSDTYIWYNKNLLPYLTSLNPELINQYFCFIFNFIELVGSNIGLYIQALFSMHRMFIMIFPFKKDKINYVFNNFLLIPVIVTVIILWIPVFIMSTPIYRYYCYYPPFCCSPFGLSIKHMFIALLE